MYVMQGENPPTHYIGKKASETWWFPWTESYTFILIIIPDCSWHKNRGNILIVQHLDSSLHINQTYQTLDILVYFTSTFSNRD